MCDQVERWAERELEDCNVEGSLKGGGKQTLKPWGEKTKSFQHRLKVKEMKNIKRANWFGRKRKKKKKKKGEAFRILRNQMEKWAERELEDCNVEGSSKGRGEKNIEAFRWENGEFSVQLKEKRN